MKSGNKQNDPGNTDRKARLAAELRANLKRRKAKAGGSETPRKKGGKQPEKTER